MDRANHQQTPGNHIVPECSGNGQPPDENYIEKLFPKCPPKQLHARTMNNFRQLNGNVGGGSTRQPPRRQNRNKFHQQHHRRDPLVVDTQVPTMLKDNLMQTSVINSADLNNNSVKCNDIDYYSSSSGSTDKEIRANGYSGVKRSSSNQYGFDSKNNLNQSDSSHSHGHQNNNASSSRQRARRYKATRNLQPRIRRSQTIHNRLNPQADLSNHQTENETNRIAAVATAATTTTTSSSSSSSSSIPTTATTTTTATLTTIPAPATSCFAPPSMTSVQANSTLVSSQLNVNESTVRAPLDDAPSSVLTSSIKPKSYDVAVGRKFDTKPINRNCRGIVFSEPLPTFNGANDANDQLATAMLTANQEDALASRTTARSQSPPLQMESVAQMPPSLAMRQQEKDGEISADLNLSDTKSNVNEVGPQSIETVTADATTASPNFLDSVGELNHTIKETDIDNSDTKLILEGDDHVKDDDKYINLFVYDNNGPQRKAGGSDRLNGDKQRLDSQKQLQPQQQNENPISVPYEAGHRLLAEDLSENEQDVIRNDTSTEELCSYDDNNIDNSKRKTGTNFSRKALENDGFNSIPEDSITNPEITTNAFVANKTHSKFHRSVGTLQTVDEKAELNADGDIGGATTEVSDASKIELIDISESTTMQSEDGLKTLKKGGLAPPGFPRRVRPQPQPPINNNVEIPTQIFPSSAVAKDYLLSSTSVDHLSLDKQIDPADSVSDALISTHAKPQTVAEVEVCDIPEKSANETEAICLGRNLSEALNKVSITKDSDTNAIDLNPTMFPSQYHKLPNESSHYSILRVIDKTQSAQTENVDLHRSRIQFNTLSDADSELDEQPNIEVRHTMQNKTTIANLTTEKKLDQAHATYAVSSSSTVSKIDDDLTPSNKTALIFPRLDEGLSSEAESCDDDVEEDDDRALEADVDADDEEGNDDDADSPTRTTNRGAGGLPINVDQFSRHQPPQSSRTQARLIGSSQQQQHSGTTTIPGLQGVPEADVQQIKPSTNSPYANFIGSHEPLDQNDLKSHSNYSNHNGQSNYWMGATSQATMSTQPPGGQNQQQFSVQRNNHHGNSNNGNDINMSRSNSYANRDEAKTVNRVSSDTDNETDRLLGTQRNDQLQKMTNNELVSNNNPAMDSQTTNSFSGKQTTNSREVLIEGVLFNVKYLGSTHTECEGRGEKEDRIHQAELAVHEVKFRNGDSQSPVEVQLFISTEKIMVLDDKHRKIMMDHSLRTISYIADIGDAIVLIVRKKSTHMDTTSELGRPISKTSCHVFESNESHTITKSISQAFQVAYTELLKANGAGDTGNYLPKELDYQEVLNSQEMSTTELEMFARKDNQREVIVPKQEGEILGLSIVESGWGSVLPTAVIASLKQDGPAYRCKKLSVGDQILSINGISLVGLSLAECQKILRKTKSQSVARLSVVPCPITVEVKIKRPDTKYQLGFSVQHGVICSLLRGGIAERGGVRVGHRIISINGTTVVGVPHDKIVTLLASSVGEIRMKTCLTSLYRHMLGEEKNVSFV